MKVDLISLQELILHACSSTLLDTVEAKTTETLNILHTVKHLNSVLKTYLHRTQNCNKIHL